MASSSVPHINVCDSMSSVFTGKFWLGRSEKISILFLLESIDNHGLDILGALVWCWVNSDPPPDPAPVEEKQSVFTFLAKLL